MTNQETKQPTVKEQRLEKRRVARIEAHRQRKNQDRTIIEFQPDAVEIERQSVPGGARWTLYTAVALIIAAVSWSIWAEVDKIVVASGKLITVEPPVVIESPAMAPIKTMNVKFGDRVKRGQVLATLDPTSPEADLNSILSSIKAYEATIERLEHERDGKDLQLEGRELNIYLVNEYRLFIARQQEYQAKIKEFQTETAKVKIQQANNELEIEMASKDFEAFDEVLRKYTELRKTKSVSEINLLSQQVNRNKSQSTLTNAKSRKSELVAELQLIERRVAAYIASWRAQIAMDILKNQNDKNLAEQELTKAKRFSELVEIRVPEKAAHEEYVVFEVADKGLGSVMQASEPMFKLIAVDVPFEADVEVQAKDIALIKVGSVVRVKLSSFPYQRHGTINGVVRTISEGSFEKEGQAGAMGGTTYKARIELENPIKLDNVRDDFRLMPGMTTIAEIKVGKRRVIEYILFPLIRYFDSSIREP